MKKLFSFMLIGSMTLLYSCGGLTEEEQMKSQKEAETEVDNILQDMGNEMSTPIEEPVDSSSAVADTLNL